VILVMYEKQAPMLALLAELGAVPADPGPAATRRGFVSASIKE
jgi:hypothetical protein